MTNAIIFILKFLKWVLYSIVILLIIAYLLLRLSAVQTYVAKKTADYLTEKAGIEINIGRLDISDFINVEIENFSARDFHDSLFVVSKRIVVKMDPAYLLDDILYIENVEVDSTFFALIEYSGEDGMNINKIIDAFVTNDSNTDTTSLKLGYRIKNCRVSNSTFVLDLQDSEHFEEMDYEHLFIDSINIEISDFRVQNDSLIGNIRHLSVNERCGFKLKAFQGQTLVSPRQIVIPNLYMRTNDSWMYANFQLKYKKWPDWLDFIKNVRFDTRLDSALINMNDIGYFSKSMVGMNNYISASSKIMGSINNLKLHKTHLSYGKNTRFNGDIAITGLPEFEQSFIRLKVKSAKTNMKDLNRFKLSDNSTLSLSNELDKFGNISFNGRFTGFYYDFVSNASFNSALGRFETDISLQPNVNKTDIRYSGKIRTTDFQLGEFIGTNYIGNISMNASIKGSGLTSVLDAKYNIDFSKIKIAGYKYKELNINGVVKNKRITSTLDFQSDTSKIFADGFFDYSDSTNQIQLKVGVFGISLNKLLMIDKDTLGAISSIINVELKGSDIDNLEGVVELDSTTLVYHGVSYKADTIMLSSILNDAGKRVVEFRSPYMNADFSGFRKVSDFPNMYNLLFHNILPNLINSNSIAVINPIEWKEHEDRLDEFIKFDIDFLESKELSQLLFPSFNMSAGSNMHGKYNFSEDSLFIKLTSGNMNFEDYDASNINLEINKYQGVMKYDINADYLQTPNEISFNSMSLFGYINTDTVDFNLLWGDSVRINNGDLNGKIIWDDTNSFQINIAKGVFYIKDSLWQIKPNAIIKSKYHYLEVLDFEIIENNNSAYINGLITDNSHDILNMKFDNFNVSLIDFYTKQWDTDLSGLISGNVGISSLWKSPGFESNFMINDFKLNGVDLHTMKMNTIYSRSREAIVVDMSIFSPDMMSKYVDFGGFFYPFKEENQFDLEMRVNKLPMKSIENYLTSFTSKVEGEATGTLRIRGSLSKPILLGAIDVNINDILVDYTNVHYKIKDKLIFAPDYFGLIDANATDFMGNPMLVTVKINHHYFDDFNLDINVIADKSQMLNTTEENNDLFYGNAFASGYFKMNGSFDKLKLNMDLTPKGESYIAIPISSQLSAEQTDFLSFVIVDSSIIENLVVTEEDPLKIEMDMFVDIKPNTTIELVMDKKVGDVISANGIGRINIVYDKDENLFIYGKYVIEKGNYLFTMQNILNKRFKIESKSNIVWDGDVENAKIEMKAVYHTEAKLWDLVQQIDTSDVYKRNSKVNCIINISGSLYNPKVSFDIKLPDESIATQELVNSLISPQATGNSEELNKNFVSLLVLGQFQAPSGYGNGDINQSLLTHNATEVLAEQVGNILNQMSDKVEIGVAYNAGDDITTQELAIALSYSMLDDRLLIDGKFGGGGGSTDENASRRVVGDLNVEYKLTKDGRIRAKVFNRTNYYDPISRKAPYTQGVGISFRKDFNTFGELFKSNKKQNVEGTEKDKSKKKKSRKKSKDKVTD